MQIGLTELALLVGGVTPGEFDICPLRRGLVLEKKIVKEPRNETGNAQRWESGRPPGCCLS